eukprot:7376327-Prymnesium_polylepis.1
MVETESTEQARPASASRRIRRSDGVAAAGRRQEAAAPCVRDVPLDACSELLEDVRRESAALVAGQQNVQQGLFHRPALATESLPNLPPLGLAARLGTAAQNGEESPATPQMALRRHYEELARRGSSGGSSSAYSWALSQPACGYQGHTPSCSPLCEPRRRPASVAHYMASSARPASAAAYMTSSPGPMSAAPYTASSPSPTSAAPYTISSPGATNAA